MKEFTTAICEKIKAYVYVLRDPRDGTIFYIGKGNNNRIFDHVSGALKNKNPNDRLDLIREIHNHRLEVEHFILRDQLEDSEALQVEAACIDFLGLSALKNKVKGHYSSIQGLKTVEDVFRAYDAKVVTITEPTIILTINRQFPQANTPEKLYDATRSHWRVGKQKLKTLQYAIAAYKGLAREVYRIEGWNPVEKSNGKTFWEFVGRVAESDIRDKYINQSLANYPPNPRNGISYSY